MKTNKAWKGFKPSQITTEQAKHVLGEAQNFLAALNVLCNRITQRAYTVLAILIAFCSIIYSFLWGSIMKGVTINLSDYWVLGLAIIPILYPIINLLRLIFPRDVYLVGRRPRDINMESFVKIPKEHKEQAFYLTEIKHSHQVIEKTEYQIRIRTKKLKRAIIFLVAYAPLFLVLLLLYSTSNG